MIAAVSAALTKDSWWEISRLLPSTVCEEIFEALVKFIAEVDARGANKVIEMKPELREIS